MSATRVPPATRLECAACGARPADDEPYPFRCPNAGDGRDHVLARRVDLARVRFADESCAQPFARHRQLLHSYWRWRASGRDDASFVALVGELDERVAAIERHGFVPTPFANAPALAARLGVREAWCKDDTRNVGGSHKARHLFGLLLHLEVSERTGLATREATDARALAIASCGNAALAAAVVAHASGRPLRVFIPTDADAAVVQRLHVLGAQVAVCARQGDAAGDPCVLGFHVAVRAGALPFGVQGNDNGLTIEGGETIGWEMASELQRRGAAIERLFVQVGGGALGSACMQALREARALGVIAALPKLHTVQTQGAWPLRRAWVRVANRALAALGEAARADDRDASRDGDLAARLAAADARSAVADALAHARANRREYMWPWESAPHSVAHGILDDETYDWAVLVDGMLETGGWPVTADEDALVAARTLARETTGVRADATGTAGLAGALVLRDRGELRADDRVAVLLTGAER